MGAPRAPSHSAVRLPRVPLLGVYTALVRSSGTSCWLLGLRVMSNCSTLPSGRVMLTLCRSVGTRLNVGKKPPDVMLCQPDPC